MFALVLCSQSLADPHCAKELLTTVTLHPKNNRPHAPRSNQRMHIAIISVLQLACRLISRPLRMVVEQQQDPFQKRRISTVNSFFQMFSVLLLLLLQLWLLPLPPPSPPPRRRRLLLPGNNFHSMGKVLSNFLLSKDLRHWGLHVLM